MLSTNSTRTSAKREPACGGAVESGRPPVILTQARACPNEKAHDPEFGPPGPSPGRGATNLENGPAGDGQSPASYGTGGVHPRGTYLHGLPSLLLGDPSLLAPPQGPIKISVPAVVPNWIGEPGDIVYNSAQADPADPAYEPYAGWICVGPLREWKRFGKIEP